MMAKYHIDLKAFRNDQEPEYPDFQLTPQSRVQEETPEENKKRKTNGNKNKDKADKRHDEVLKSGWRRIQRRSRKRKEICTLHDVG